MSFLQWTSLFFRARRTLAIGVLAALLTQTPAMAQTPEPLPAPQGPVILLVTGAIGVTNTPEGAAFDREMLYALGRAETATSTPWTDGVPVFGGVLARTVFERVGAEGTTVQASALNDYTVAVPMADFETYDVLLATEMDGEEMRVSDKGPIWIVYPRDGEPALQDRRLHDRWVWQLKALEVQ
jgi:hypothetical protein